MMISFAVLSRDDNPKVLLINDVDVAVMLGICRSTVWAWLDQEELPEPLRFGKVRTGDQERSARTLWRKADIALFAECESMAEFRRRKRQ